MRIKTTSSLVFACHSAACAPPPAGSGGSSGGNGAKKGKSASDYAKKQEEIAKRFREQRAKDEQNGVDPFTGRPAGRGPKYTGD